MTPDVTDAPLTANVPSLHRPARHYSQRAGWLRAAVLGANDGILSTGSLVLGVAASGAGRAAIVTAGIAGMVAGAMSMAAGEYVSVSSQRDAERADLGRERTELAEQPEAEHAELARIYRERGLSQKRAEQVATELAAGDLLRIHAHDELGIDIDQLARPFQAAWTSATAFAVGALIPLLTITRTASSARLVVAIVVTLVSLAGLGVLGARLGRAPLGRAAVRVAIGGAFALAVTMAIGALVGAAIG